MKIRIKFTKHGTIKFIGHLDMMRYFQKAIRRAGIDITYTEGFSPHQVMSFAAPLSVGVESSGEYFDIQVNSTKNSLESIMLLNNQMAQGVTITQYRRLDDSTKSAMSKVAAASYIVYYKDNKEYPFDENKLNEYICKYIKEEDTILVEKKSKKSTRVINLKPNIYEFSDIRNNKSNLSNFEEDKKGFFMMVAAGSVENIKPSIVLEYFYNKVGVEFDISCMQIERIDVFYDDNGVFKPLGNEGVDIF